MDKLYQAISKYQRICIDLQAQSKFSLWKDIVWKKYHKLSIEKRYHAV